jgi:hypothetical protein
VLRGGYGVYYDQSPLAPGEALYFNAPYFNLNYYFPLPGLPLELSNPFPAGFPLRLPGSAFGFDPGLRTAYTQHWNLSLQRELGLNRVVELAYVGSKGTKLLATRDLNQPGPSPRQPNLRPNPIFDEISLQGSMADSNYHSLQAKFQQRLAGGLSVIASYTWSKSIDNASGIFAAALSSPWPMYRRPFTRRRPQKKLSPQIRRRPRRYSTNSRTPFGSLDKVPNTAPANFFGARFGITDPGVNHSDTLPPISWSLFIDGAIRGPITTDWLALS